MEYPYDRLLVQSQIKISGKRFWGMNYYSAWKELGKYLKVLLSNR